MSWKYICICPANLGIRFGGVSPVLETWALNDMTFEIYWSNLLKTLSIQPPQTHHNTALFTI